VLFCKFISFSFLLHFLDGLFWTMQVTKTSIQLSNENEISYKIYNKISKG
jgi:hypothetical protein